MHLGVANITLSGAILTQSMPPTVPARRWAQYLQELVLKPCTAPWK